MHSRPVAWIPPVLALMLCLAGAAHAKPWWMRGIESNDTDFLPPDVAFRVAARLDGNVLKVRWVIADGYYLYRQKIDVKAESPDLVVSAPELPTGTTKTDPYLGTQQVFFQQVEAVVPYSRLDAGAHPIQLKVTYQGCAEAGLCYPPITKVVFPSVGAPPVAANVPPYPWESLAIVVGAFAFLLAGLVLRKGRKLDIPA
ncbi:MAG TPA: protein-disulfide reductase DsbD domain-containing protein [Steroidobacteraceae bacterium]